jgi:glycine hydroxymethyltransferase
MTYVILADFAPSKFIFTSPFLIIAIIFYLRTHENLINDAVFPGLQGGPHQNQIAAVACQLNEVMTPEFKEYIKNVKSNAKEMCKALIERGYDIITGGTDNHLVLLKTDSVNLTGKEAEHILEKVNITCNKNMIPRDTRSPFVTSGIRLGTPALTSRGFKEDEIKQVASIIIKSLKNKDDAVIQNNLRNDVLDLTKKFPLY